MERVTKTKEIEHPMEELLNIAPGTTVVEYSEVVQPPAVVPIQYDDKDSEINDQLEVIYTTALSIAMDTSDQIERVEGKFKARLGEVAATNLTVALNAVREKSSIKMHKDKLSNKGPTVGGDYTVNNNLVVADRNEILRALAAGDKK